ncbi:PA3496 family putative envelope integrity protein [Aurantivibrio plasticivorans]
MSSESSSEFDNMDLDDWTEMEDDEQELTSLKDIDSRRMVENKLEELRLQRELNDYDFGL